MPTIPIRFKRGQGLEIAGNQKTQQGLLELANVDLEIDDVIRKRPGHTEIELLDPNNDPVGAPIECWYREEELCIGDGLDLAVRRDSEFPGKLARRGPWTRTRLRVSTIYDSGRVKLNQAGAARVRDASGWCDVIATELQQGEPATVRWDVLADSGERWPLTANITESATNPLAFNSADDRAILSFVGLTNGLAYRRWLKGTSLPASRAVATLTAAQIYDGDGATYQFGDYAAFVYLESAPSTVRVRIHWYGTDSPVDVFDTVSIGGIENVQAVAIHAVADPTYAGARIALAVSGQDGAADAYSRVLVRSYLSSTGALDTETIAVDQFVEADPNTVIAVAVGFLGAAINPGLDIAEVRTEVQLTSDDLPKVFIDRIEPGVFGTQLTYRGSAIYSALELVRGELCGVVSVVEAGDTVATTPDGFHDQRRVRRSGFMLLSLRRYFVPLFPFSLSAVVGEVVGRFAALQGELASSDRTTNVRTTRRVQRLSGNQLDLVTGLAREGDEDDTRTLAQSIAWDMTERPNNPAMLARIAVSAHGGYPRMYDGIGMDSGIGVNEHDWHVLPVVLGAAESVGGGNLSAGKYGLALTWEWTDGQGQLYRSAPDFVGPVTVAAMSRILINWRPLFHSERRGVRAVWWRTKANGAVYYRDTVETAQLNQELGITFLGQADDDIAIQPQLDQVLGSTRVSTPAPITDWVAATGGRLWGPDPWRGDVIRYSIPVALGRASHWTPVQAIQTTTGERATGLADLDGRIVVFTPRRVAYTAGPGPDERGRGSDYPVLAQLATEVGALEHVTIAEVPDGLVYGSFSGPRLLTRGLGIVLLASPVERAYDLDGETLRVAVYDHARATLRLANDAETFETAGRLFRMHTGSYRWALDTGIDPRDMGGSFHGQFALVTRDGRLLVQDSATWTDGGIAYTTLVSTPWLHEPTKDGLVHGGYKVGGGTVFGERRGAHGLQWRFYFNYQLTPEWSPVNPEATITARNAAGQPYTYRGEANERHCYAARVTVDDQGAATEGFVLEGLDITFGGDQSSEETQWPPDVIASE